MADISHDTPYLELDAMRDARRVVTVDRSLRRITLARTQARRARTVARPQSDSNRTLAKAAASLRELRRRAVRMAHPDLGARARPDPLSELEELLRCSVYHNHTYMNTNMI